MGRRR